MDYGVQVRVRSWYADGQIEEDIWTAASSSPKHFAWAADGTMTRSDVDER